jgi:uncharacterized protein
MAVIVRDGFRLDWMKTEFAPRRLDIAAFADAGATLSGTTPLHDFPRLSADAPSAPSDAVVRWQASGARRAGATGASAAWLHLVADTRVPLVCQRCLALVETELAVDRWFRFAADEETAAFEDEDAEEDVLVISRDFDLQALLEDELLMEIPVTPRHDVCPQAPSLSAVDADFEASEQTKPNPFAVLGTLRPRKSE